MIQVREAEEKAEQRINEAKSRYDDHLKKLETNITNSEGSIKSNADDIAFIKENSV